MSDITFNNNYNNLKIPGSPPNFSENLVIMMGVENMDKFFKEIEQIDASNYRNRMLSSISHELRTPLNCSIILLREALEDKKISEKYKDAFIRPSYFSN